MPLFSSYFCVKSFHAHSEGWHLLGFSMWCICAMRWRSFLSLLKIRVHVFYSILLLGIWDAERGVPCKMDFSHTNAELWHPSVGHQMGHHAQMKKVFMPKDLHAIKGRFLSHYEWILDVQELDRWRKLHAMHGDFFTPSEISTLGPCVKGFTLKQKICTIREESS